MMVKNYDCESYVYKTETIGYYLPNKESDSLGDSMRRITPVLKDLYMPDLSKSKFLI